MEQQMIERLPIIRPHLAEKRRELFQYRLQYILQSRADNLKSVVEVSKELGISKQTYYHIIKRAGIRIAPSLEGGNVQSGDTGNIEATISAKLDEILSRPRPPRGQAPRD